MKEIRSVTLTAAALAMLAFSVPVPAFSQIRDMSGMNERRAGHGQMLEMDHMDMMAEMPGMCIDHAEKVGLGDDQLRKMKPAHIEMQKRHARFKADLKIAEIELMEIMDVKDFDLEKANLAVKKIAEIKSAHHLENLKAMKEMRTILTDDQYKKMKKLMSMKMSEHKTGEHKRGEHKPSKHMMKK